MKAGTRISLTGLRIVIGVALLYYVLSLTGGWQAVLKLRNAPWVLVALPFAAMLGGALEALRLGLLCRSQNIHLPFGQGFRLMAIGCLFNLVIPGGTGGDVMKLYYMARDNRGRAVEAGLVLLVDRAFALALLLLLLLGLAMWNWDLVAGFSVVRWLVALAAAAVVVFGGLMALSFTRRWRGSKVCRFASQRLPFWHFFERVLDALYAFRGHKRELLGASLWSLAGHLLFAGVFLVIGPLLMPGGPIRWYPFLALLSTLANAIPITPGGMGVGEAAADSLFRLVDLRGGAALILTWRLSLLPLCALGAFFYIAGVRRIRGETQRKTARPRRDSSPE